MAYSFCEADSEQLLARSQSDGQRGEGDVPGEAEQRPAAGGMGQDMATGLCSKGAAGLSFRAVGESPPVYTAPSPGAAHQTALRLTLGGFGKHHPLTNWDIPESIKIYDMYVSGKKDLSKCLLFTVTFQ